MANKRYGRILASAKYYSAIDNYIQYITQASRRGSRVGSGRARQESQVLFIEPFSRSVANAQKVQVSAAEPTWNLVAANGVVTDYVKATPPPNAGLIVKLADFRSARVTIARNRSGQGTAKTSAVTGLKYLSYGGTSTSIPFGKPAITQTEEVSFNAIKAALAVASGFSGARFSWSKEK